MADLSVSDVQNVEGAIAHDAAYSTANPVPVGAYASAATPTAVNADGDMVRLWAGTRGQLAVMVVDSTGTQVASGVQYVEDAALTANAAQGTLIGARRDDALSTLTPVQDDFVGLRVGDKGALWVQISDGSGNQITSFGGGTQYVEDAALGVVGSATGTLAMARASAAAPTAVSADADAVAIWAGRSGQQAVMLVSSAGTVLNSLVSPLGDAASNSVSGAIGISYGYMFNGTTWDRVKSQSGQGDSLTNASAGMLTTPMLTGYNGASWDRLRTTAIGDATTTGILAAGTYGWNGSNNDRLRVIAALSTAPNVDTGVLAVGMGPGFDKKRDPANLGTAANSASTFTIDGADVVLIDIRTSTTGTYAIELTADDTNWVTAGSCMLMSTEQWVTPSGLTPTSGNQFKVATTGWRQIRLRTVTTLGATMAHKVTFSAGVHMVKAVDVGPAQHNMGYALVTKTAQYTTTQTGTAIWTPASGKKVVVMGMLLGAGGTTAGTVQVWFGATADTTYTRGTDKAIFDHEFAPSNTLKPGVVMGYGNFPIGVGAVDDVLRFTDSAAINPITVTVWGYEA